MTPLQSIFDGTASWQDLLAFCLVVGVALGLLVGGALAISIRLRRWLAGGRPLLEITWEREAEQAALLYPDVLRCHSCHQSYVARPSERTEPEYLCRACAAEAEAA